MSEILETLAELVQCGCDSCAAREGEVAAEITRLRAESANLLTADEQRFDLKKKELRDLWGHIETHGSIYASIRSTFGERCKDVHPICGTCRAWEEYDEVGKLRAENERLREALALCRTELRTAAGYRGYEGGPLDHPSVDLALRLGDDALKGESE